MIFARTKINDVVVCEPTVFGDDRGYFTETYREDKIQDFLGYKINFCQDNESKSSKGVLRGLHYQLAPHAQSKLVRVIKGKILDVVVDIRVGSETFGEHVRIKLSAENKKQLFVPRGFAHGFVVLSDEAIFAYKVDNYYSPKYDRGIDFKDSDLNIDWVMEEDLLKLSEKDLKHPKLKDVEDLFDNSINYYQ